MWPQTLSVPLLATCSLLFVCWASQNDRVKLLLVSLAGSCHTEENVFRITAFCVFWGHWPFSKSEWLSIIQCVNLYVYWQSLQEASRQWASLSSLQNSLSHDENWQKTIYNRNYVFSFLLWGGASPFCFTLLFCAASVYAAFTCTKLVRRSSLCFWMNVHHHSCCLDNEIYYISSSMKLDISSFWHIIHMGSHLHYELSLYKSVAKIKKKKFAWAGASKLLTGYVRV